MNKEELWQALLAQIQFNTSKANFATWFRNTDIVSKKEGQIVVSVPNNFSKEWLENKYNKLIFKILHSLDEEVKDVKYDVIRSGVKTAGTVTSPTESDPLSNFQQLEFTELKIAFFGSPLLVSTIIIGLLIKGRFIL